MSFESLLQNTCTVYRLDPQQDTYGGAIGDWSDETTFRCRSRRLSANEAFVAVQRGYEATHRFYIVPSSTAINNPNVGDQLKHEQDGTYHKVTHINIVRGRGGSVHHWELDTDMQPANEETGS